MSAVPTIRRDSTSYRQGLILGLTMAETMLLLVFCLLMAAAMVFTRDRAQLKATEEERLVLSDAYEKTKADLREARSSLSYMQTHTQSGSRTTGSASLTMPPLSRNWRRQGSQSRKWRTRLHSFPSLSPFTKRAPNQKTSLVPSRLMRRSRGNSLFQTAQAV